MDSGSQLMGGVEQLEIHRKGRAVYHEEKCFKKKGGKREFTLITGKKKKKKGYCVWD